MPELICDTSALVALHQTGRLDVLQSLSTAVTVPAAVEQEIAAGQSMGHDVPDPARVNWMTIRSPATRPQLPNASELGPGESDVLWLAQETATALLS